MATTLIEYKKSTYDVLPGIGREKSISVIDYVNSRLKKSLGSAPFTLSPKSFSVRNFVGVIPIGEYGVIEILPKISNIDDEQILRSNLIEMLMVTRSLRFMGTGNSDLSFRRNSLLDYFVECFAKGLFRELQRGPINLYNPREEDLGLIKGKILFEQKILSGGSLGHLMPCRYDEFEAVNPVNSILLSALTKALNAASSFDTKRILNNCIKLLDGVPRILSTNDMKNVSLDRRHKRFEPYFEFAKAILAEGNPNLAIGEVSSFPMIFDMNKLFEEYIGRTIKKVTDKEVNLQGPRHFLTKEVQSDKNRFQLKPDIVILGPNKKVEMIIDTKWKLLSDEDSKSGVSEGDIYQMHAYAKRYECNNLVLLYPKTKDFILPTYKFNVGGERIRIATVDLIDLSKVPTQLESIVTERT